MVPTVICLNNFNDIGFLFCRHAVAHRGHNNWLLFSLAPNNGKSWHCFLALQLWIQRDKGTTAFRASENGNLMDTQGI